MTAIAGRLTIARHRIQIGKLLYFLPAVICLVLVLTPASALPYDPTQALGRSYLPPSAAHWFGTDSSGMDVYSRTIAAFRLDVLIGFLVSVFTIAIAAILGVLLGYYEGERSVRGWIARLFVRVAELFQSIPVMVAALVIVALFGLAVPVIVTCFAIVLAPAQIRLVRTEVLKVRGSGYVDSARVAGLGSSRIAITRVLPNAIWPLLENWPWIFAMAVMIISALGFLGVGLAPPTPEWGAMISGAASDAGVGRWWTFVYPSLALSLTVFAALALRTGVNAVLPKHFSAVSS